MKKIMIMIIAVLPFKSALAENTDSFIFKDFDQFDSKIKENHFIFYGNSMWLQHEILHEYDGINHDYKPREHATYLGGGFGIGYNFKLGNGFSTTSEFSAFQLMKRDRNTKKAKEEYDFTVAENSEKHRIYGINISQSLNYTFETKYFNFEPFAQIIIGQAKLSSEVDYFYDDTIAANTEEYHSKIKEDLTTSAFSFGINIISRSGLFSYLKGQKNIFTIGDKEQRTSLRLARSNISSSSTKVKVNENQDRFSMGLGFGYIF